MGQLLHMSDFYTSEKCRGTLDPRWYFTNAYRNPGSGGGWWIDIKIEPDFPHRRGIHWKHFNEKDYDEQPEHRQLRVDIRRFVERQCLGNALVVNDNMSYEYLYEVDEKYRVNKYGDAWRRSGVHHGYYVFHFEEEEDAALFALKFAGKVTEISSRHPDRDVPEEQIEHAEREKWKGQRSTW